MSAYTLNNHLHTRLVQLQRHQQCESWSDRPLLGWADKARFTRASSRSYALKKPAQALLAFLLLHMHLASHTMGLVAASGTADCVRWAKREKASKRKAGLVASSLGAAGGGCRRGLPAQAGVQNLILAHELCQ